MSVPGRAPDDPVAPAEWKQAAPNDSFSYFHTESTTIILQTLDPFILNQTKNFTTPKLHIYAETIKIAEDVTFPGKELGLFCNKLILEYPKDRETIEISVSGLNGGDGVPNKYDIDTKGKPGGKIILYVEEPEDSIFPTLEKKGLFLKAAGGDGGHGAPNIGTGDTHGGPGGNGGDGGTINIYFGHSLIDLRCKANVLVADEDIAWTAKMKLLSEYDFKDDTINSNLRARIVQDGAYIDKIDKIRQIVAYLPFDSAPAEIKDDEGQKIIKSIQRHLSCAKQPRMPDSSNVIVENCRKAVDAIRTTEDDIVTPELWKAYGETTSALSTVLDEAVNKPLGPGEGDIASLLRNGCDSLGAFVEYHSDNMRLMFSCDAGKAGIGGSGVVTDTDRGKDGSSGVEGVVNVRELDFTDSADNLTIPDPIISPDQCQMMVNQIDMMYFRASGGATVPTLRGKPGQEASKTETPTLEAYKNVKMFYERLERRLRLTVGLQDQLASQVDLSKLDKASLTKYAMLCSFVEMEQRRLTLDPFSQLAQMRMHTFMRLNWLAAGKDFMGHYGRWVPRLGYDYYNKQLQGFIQAAVDFAKRFESQDFKTLETEQLRSAQKETNNLLEAVKIRISLITDPENGDLVITGSQIKAFTPLLKSKRLELNEMISKARVKIAKHINFDPKIILDSLSMIAFAPTGFNIAAQGAGGVYKMGTTVTGLDGQQVDKKYVVSQFGTAGSTLSDLEAAYKARGTGELEVDDPGATKLISTKEELDKLVENFKDAIGDLYDVLKWQLKEYLSLVESRNKAVMLYNSSVSLLVKAIADREYYEHKLEMGGQALLSIDPRAPAVRLWLTKCRQDLRVNILTALYRGEKALQFWGLCNDFDPIAVADDFSDLDLLQRRNQEFQKVFDNVLHEQAKNPGSIFPARQIPGKKPDLSGGKCFYLPLEVCKYFANNPTIESFPAEDPAQPPIQYKKYQVMFKVPTVRKSTPKTASDLSNRADIRLDEVRIWIFGASVEPGANGTRQLTLSLQHCGNDSIVRPQDDRVFEFNHDSVLLSFSYDPQGVNTFQDTLQAQIWESINLPSFRGLVASHGVHSTAPFGPFADWRLSISEQHNIGLKLSPEASICIEFWGESRAFPL
ncbi:hypothetical protein V8C37DRAFT_388463 [Trichoderma ceciliae]